MSDIELYSHYFVVGKKVGVSIPLPNADVFKDWAIIHDIDEDLVSLQLSRDDLPSGVSLHYGQILELRGGVEDKGYCCRAIVVSEGVARELLLRLIGEVVSDELREFYRIDAFLPIKYFVSHEQNIDRLHKQWEERRVHRQQLEVEQKDHHWTGGLLPADAGLPPERLHGSLAADDEKSVSAPDTTEDKAEDSWDAIIPLAANISGGGLRIVTHQGFEYGEYTLLEIFVPSPERVVDVIGRVVFANRNYAAGSDREYFNTGVQFVYIDERDRDAIVTYISTIQLKRIRQLRERYLYRGVLDDDEQTKTSESSGMRRVVKLTLSALFFLLLIAFLSIYFRYYVREHPKGEIERTFEDGVIKYKEQQKQK
ncbi:MAG: PilZ domain-containing protein [Desulfuromonadaceae bacterium]|nr:PilZ domain-containing protein [Desulfuromonadaceae bacterium]